MCVCVCVCVSVCIWGFPGGSDGKQSACNIGDPGSIPGLGRCPGEENGYPFQYSFLVNSVDRGTWRATVHGVSKSQTQPSTNTFSYLYLSVERDCVLLSSPK